MLVQRKPLQTQGNAASSHSVGSGRGSRVGCTHISSANPRTTALRNLALAQDGLPGIIRGKYKLRILWKLQAGPLRFGALRKELTKASGGTKEIAPRVLSRELKSLVDLGLVLRRAYNVVPPKVEYRLTALGRSLLPVISVVIEWGRKHRLRRTTLKELSYIPRSPVAEASGRNFAAPIERNIAFANRVNLEHVTLQR